jgi:RimJ/RimL family protein N-acetyltransferase
VERFVDDVVFADPSVRACVIDPELANVAAIRAYEKAGFVPVRTVEVPGHRSPELIMRKLRNGEGRS